MSYRLLEDIATADIAFEAEGKTPEELFKSAATALEEIQTDTSRVEPTQQKIIQLETEDLGELLFDFLNELIYLKDSEGLVFSKFDLELRLDSQPFVLHATIFGEVLDRTRHELRTDIKAVTKHMFAVKKENSIYRATVVLDV